MKSYKDLEIYTQTFDLAIRIYFLTIKLPNPDKFETGSQIRRSSQSIKDNTIEAIADGNTKPILLSFWYTVMQHCLNQHLRPSF